MPDFYDPTRLGAWPASVGAQVTENSGSPSAGAKSLRFPGGSSLGVSFTRDTIALGAGDFHIEGLVQFDAGTVGSNVLICCHAGGSQFAVYRNGATGGLSLNFNSASTSRVNGATVMNANALHAWSLTRVSGVNTLRLNGVSQGAYTDSAPIGLPGSPGTIYFGGGSVASGLGALTGYMDELVLYRAAVYTADYAPTYAEVPEGAANPNWGSIAFLIHGDCPIVASRAALAGPDSLSLYAPSWPVTPRVTPDVTRLDTLRNFGTRALSGVVDYITAPAAGRIVRAYDKASGILLRETTTAGDGTYSFPDLLGSRDYYVVALDSPPNPASAWDTDISPIVQAT